MIYKSEEKYGSWTSNSWSVLGQMSKMEKGASEERVCRSILRGLRIQMIEDGVMSLNNVGTQVQEENYEEWIDKEGYTYYDDISGSKLDARLVEAARGEEIGEMKKRGIYTKVPVEECWRRSGKKPVGVKFVDVNKGDDEKPVYRSRLVAREFKEGAATWFAATPPLEAIKVLLSMAAVERGRRKVAFIDVKKAHLYAKATREVFIDLPPGDEEPGKCGRLNYTLYGTRDAAQAWELEYTNTLKEMGFKQGKSSNCVFRHDERNIDVVVHGDDFTILALDKDIDWCKEGLEEKYELKLRGVLGPGRDPRDTTEITILNRVVKWGGQGIEYEADPRHAEIIIKQLGLREGKAAATPGTKASKGDEDGEPLVGEEATNFRALTARANYLAQDRPDITFAVKELTRRMAGPTTKDFADLKRLGRYLLGRPRLVLAYAYQPRPKYIDVWVDSDWAGCVRTRRSTSGGGVKWGSHVCKWWATTQATIALSSGEAEYYALVKGASQALGMQSLLADFNQEVKIRVHSDSSAAIGISGRSGLGKTRHVAVHLLWLQGHVRDGHFEILKVKGADNGADIFTKYLDKNMIDMLLEKWSADLRGGRSAIAPQVVT